MENKKRKTLTAGSMIAGAILSMTAVNANAGSNLFQFNALGNGTEVRTHIKSIELNCGEKKEGKKEGKKEEKGEKKGKEGKCGEKKAKDGKCGEGKCGEKKNPK